MLELKEYQKKALEVLQGYFAACIRLRDEDSAFYEMTKLTLGQGIPYNPVSEFRGLPFVCLRIPTGGGKTLMACHSVGLAQRHYLHTYRSLVLWLTPSNPIREQTLKALRDRRHPYREALEEGVGPVEILDITEALYIQRSLLDAQTVVLISSIQAFRVDEIEIRKVYEQSGVLEHHFSGITPDKARELNLICYEGSDIPIPSLANVLCLRRPLVIVDEAHNTHTDLSFDTFARFRPSCVLEFTATPDLVKCPSNILYSCSPWELKSENMIKIPIFLEMREQWQELLLAAISRLKQLKELTELEQKQTGEFLRPIMLLQAQSKGAENVTVEVLKDFLLENKIPEDQIAIATGAQRELDSVDLMDSKCPIRFIITIQALREGWDCPFAYVLYSVSGLHSKTASEQILGRILRLPHAKEKVNAPLNLGYAFVTSKDFAASVNSLVVSLEQNGFKPEDARAALIHATPQDLFATQTDLVIPPTFNPKLPPDLKISVPCLSVKIGDFIEQLEDQHLLDFPCDYSAWDAHLTDKDYSLHRPEGKTAQIDIKKDGRLKWNFVDELQAQFTFLDTVSGWDESNLIRWLDRHITHLSMTQDEFRDFLVRELAFLLKRADLTLPELITDRSRLRSALEKKVADLNKSAKVKAFKTLELGGEFGKIEVHPDICFKYDRNHYPVTNPYRGPFVPKKHYYSLMDEMNGEELACAQFIDGMKETKAWVRNIARDNRGSFWLQTPSDKCFPDFICLLEDGRYLAIEYKRENDWSNDDSEEKRLVGAIWEGRSNGTCLFVMPKGKDFSAITNKLGR